MDFLANIFKFLGGMSSTSTVGCWRLFIDEPEMPKSMIEKI